ncbi:NAD(P)-binding protein [Coniochaeta hoffmannii]|uniref:NAD(P)-binding protein n=1 Tax=Coniochaeta hoffmannii TaxID=91930 RepID=A0AA38VEQ1_9PEZI|nr:NAD(P)-binding protein [Coniochaeta hoffmannii]
MSTINTPKKTIFFLGATGGCGFATLRRCLEAGHSCIALCRIPSKLSARLSPSLLANLRLEEGNAHDPSAIARCLVNPSSPDRMVDMVISSIGLPINFKTFSIDDPHVCEKALRALLEALARVRKSGATTATGNSSPRIVTLSTNGIAETGRDFPLLEYPLYHVLLRVPHRDKKAMEDALVASGERWTVVRPALLTDGPAVGKVRAGVEDVAGRRVERSEIGYSISREDVGGWVFENLVQESDESWLHKAASITY